MTILPAVALAVCIAACGSSGDLTVPDDTVFRDDVKNYITEILDANASISIFEAISSEVEGDTLTATCLAMYSGQEEDYRRFPFVDEMTLRPLCDTAVSNHLQRLNEHPTVLLLR